MRRFSRWAVAYLVWLACAGVSAVALSFLMGRLVPAGAWASLAAGCVPAWYFLKKNGSSRSRFFAGISFWEGFILALFILFSLRTFLWLFYASGREWRVLLPNNLGDMSIHVLFIVNLANGVPFWPENPYFSGHPLTYYIGMDLFNAALLLVGVPLPQGLIWTGLLACAVTAIALWRWGRGFAMAGFLLNGGLTAFVSFHALRFQDYPASFSWRPLFMTLFATQRGFLYALPAGLFLLAVWRDSFFRSDKENPEIPLFIQVILYAAMPLFHFHTFIFLSLLLGSWAIFIPRLRGEIFRLIGWSFAPAAVLTVLVTGGFQNTSMVHWRPGWEQPAGGFWSYWALNFGLFALFFPALFVKCLRRKCDPETTAFFLPSAGFFLVFCNVMLSPWPWDNIKLLAWCYLASLPYLWSGLIVEWPKAVRYSVCFFLFFSGFCLMTVAMGPGAGYKVFSVPEVRGVESMVRDLPFEARFAAAPAYNHPLFFCGRKLALGYGGWAYSHGLQKGDRLEQLRRVMMGASGWEKDAERLKIDYIFWGPREREQYRGSLMPWKSPETKIAFGEWGEIYSTRRIRMLLDTSRNKFRSSLGSGV